MNRLPSRLRGRAPANGQETRAAANIHRANIRWDKVRSGFSGPTQVTSAPDGTKRLFVVQEGGQVKIVKGRHVQNAPYLNLASRVTTAGEGGLLSIAFSPRFRHNGLLWVAYARSSDGDLVIARMKANRAKANRVHVLDAASDSPRRTLLAGQPLRRSTGVRTRRIPLRRNR